MPPTSSPTLTEIESKDEIRLQIELNEIIAGDLNAHDELWDPNGNPDKKGGTNLAKSLLEAEVTLC